MLNRAIFAFAAILATPLAALAGDAALYDPAPPANSAFVRFVDAKQSGAASGTIGSVALDVDADGVSPFVVVPAGQHDLALRDAKGDVSLEAGNYYTVVFNEAGQSEPVVIKDEVLDNPAKAGLHFYNLTGEPALSLTAPAQKVVLFENVAPGEMKYRPVGAVAVTLAIEAGGKPVADVGEVKLERRAAKSVLAMAGADGVHAVVVDNTIAR
jgi:alginate O-acetyltransferase complex protein AlgF